MMILKNYFKTLMILVAVLVLKPQVALAQYYGGTNETAQLVLDKKIRSLPNGESMDNIDKSVKVFFEDDMIDYSIMIRNSGNTILNNIELKDYMPAYISLFFYPGEYDSGNRLISWKIDQMNPGEEKTYLIRGKIDETATLDANAIVQMTNKAEARTDKVSDSDTASYFIGGALIPETGDLGLILKTGMVLSAAAGGWFLRKQARGY